MCTRRDGEPLSLFYWRALGDQPRIILSVIGIVAASVLYVDMKAMFASQAEINSATVLALQEVNQRLARLEVLVEEKQR